MEAQILKVEQLFDEADKTADGKLSLPEFQKLVEKIEGKAASVTDTEALFRGADEDKSDAITKVEFVNLVKAMLGNDQVTLSKTLFRAYDADGSGFLEFQEVTKLYKQLGKEITDDEAKEVCTKYGTDGKISFPELHKHLFNQEVPEGQEEVYKKEEKEEDKKSSACCLLI